MNYEAMSLINLPQGELKYYRCSQKPLPLAARSETQALIAEIVTANPAYGMDVCPRLSVLCCPV
jgi:hypothetical protein